MKFWNQQKILILILIFYWKIIYVLSKKCPPSESILPCRCSLKEDEMQIWCSHSNLPQIMDGIKSIARNVKESVDELILENNHLPALSGRFFSSLKILRLMLRYNNIERLSQGWLNELEDSLIEIFIVEKQLRSIPMESLIGLKKIEAITIQSDELKRIPDFSGLISLKYLNIQSQSLLELPTSSFQHLPNIQNIYINYGKNLNRLESGLFNNLASLKSLDLSRNGISWIHLRSLFNLPSLSVLKLSQNQISDVGMIGRVIKDLENLQKLRLDKNLITTLDEGSFVDLPLLKELYLNDNRITEIQYGSFHRIPNLKIIYLHNNNIKHIHPESFLQPSGTGVEMLYLYNNEISRIEELKFLLDALPTLKFLDLSNNYLTNIPFGALHGHGNIEQLHLDNNLIDLIERDALMAMPALRELRLRNNSLSDILPLPFWNLPGLKGLDLAMNNFKSINSLLFTGIPSLRRLDLSQNNITLIDPATFFNTPLLETLNISFNSISFIHPTTFKNLERLFEIDASYNYLKGMIPGLPKIVERISVRGNEINNLPTGVVKSFNLPNLRMLDMSYNYLEHIPKLTFQFIIQLRVLSLASNRIRILQDNTFSGAYRLEMLHLQENQINEIEEECFQPLSDLRDLNLQGNKIEIITDSIFANNSHLEQLDLSSNTIRELSPMAFKNLKSLKYLDLSGNLLTGIPDSFSHLSTLKDIDISFNRLSFLPPLVISSWRNVLEIRLSNNQIQELVRGTFKNLPKIQYIDLSSNEINNIEPHAIEDLPELQELVLADNKLQELKDHVFKNLPNLQAVHLQHNLLQFISPNSFYNSPSLVYLNLSANHFRTMENVGVRNMKNLEVLDLTANTLRTIETMPLQSLNWLVELKLDDNQICRIQGTPFEMMPRLRVLSVKNNRIMRLAEPTFRKLRGNIAVLDVDGNPIFCSCELMWLRVWLEETNSPYPGPKCQNGKFLRNSRIDKSECNDLSYSNRLPLMNDHGDLFSRQLIDECENELPENFEQKPLPGESEYFYDQYIDFPNNDSFTTMKNYPNSADSSPFNIPPPKSPSSTPSSLTGSKNSTLNYNLHNRPHRPSANHGNSSPFTFFGYPLPNLNVGNILSYGRKEGNNIKNGNPNDPKLSPISSRGKVRMYRPTDSELEKYLNQETQFRDITSRNRAPSSAEIVNQDEQHTFKTSFKTPNVERGGFTPIIPNRFGGFLPNEDPFGNTNNITSPQKNITNKSDSEIDNIFEEDMKTKTTIPITPVSLIPPPQKYDSTEGNIYKNHDQMVDFNPPTTPISVFNSEESSMRKKVIQKITFATESSFSAETAEPPSVTDPLIFTTDDENFPINSTPETILLIPPEDEQQKYSNKPKIEYSNDKIDKFIESIGGTLPSINLNQQSKSHQRSGRPIITKVYTPQTPNLPTAEEYFRTTANSNSDSEVQSNEYVTASYYDPSSIEFRKKSGMDWYYENYGNPQSDNIQDIGKSKAINLKYFPILPAAMVLLIVFRNF